MFFGVKRLFEAVFQSRISSDYKREREKREMIDKKKI